MWFVLFLICLPLVAAFPENFGYQVPTRSHVLPMGGGQPARMAQNNLALSLNCSEGSLTTPAIYAHMTHCLTRDTRVFTSMTGSIDDPDALEFIQASTHHIRIMCANSKASYWEFSEASNCPKKNVQPEAPPEEASVCVIGCGLSGMWSSVAVLDRLENGNIVQFCNGTYSGSTSSLSTGVFYFPVQEAIVDTMILYRFAEVSSLNGGSTSLSDAFVTNIKTHIHQYNTDARHALNAFNTTFHGNVADSIYRYNYNSDESQGNIFQVKASSGGFKLTHDILTFLQDRLNTMPSLYSFVPEPVLSIALNDHNGTTLYSHQHKVECDHVIFATGGAAKMDSEWTNKSLATSSNTGIAWFSRDRMAPTSPTQLYWYAPGLRNQSKSTFKLTPANTWWFPGQHCDLVYDTIPMNLSYADRGFEMVRKGIKELRVYSRQGSYQISPVPTVCTESAKEWAGLFGCPAERFCGDQGTLSVSESPELYMVNGVIDSTYGVLTTPNFRCTSGRKWYYVGNAGAYPMAGIYMAPGATLGFGVYSGYKAADHVTRINNAKTRSEYKVPNVPYSVNDQAISWFITAMWLFFVSLGIISVLPWIDRLYGITCNKIASKTCDNHLPQWIWTTVSCIHGILMIVAFGLVLAAVHSMSLFTDVKLNLKRKSHGTTGYVTLLFWLIQLLAGTSLWLWVTFFRISEFKKWLSITLHAGMGIIIASLMIYMIYSGTQYASHFPYDWSPYRSPLFTFSCIIYVTVCIMSAFNLSLWKYDMSH